MKRFYIFLALLLTLTTTWAQTLLSDCTPLSSETIPTGYYFIASTESSLYEKADPFIAEQNGALCLVNKADVTNDLSTSSLGVWYITNTGIKKNNADGGNIQTYTIKSLQSDKLWAPGDPVVLANPTMAPYYNIAYNAAGYYQIKGTTEGNMGNHNWISATSATSFHGDNGTNSHWKLIPITKEITINFTDENGSKFSQTFSNVFVGTYTPTLSFYTNISSINVTNDQDTYEATCQNNFPFTVSTDANKTWNYLRLRRDTDPIKNCFLKAMDNDEIQSRDNAVRTSLTTLRAYYDDENCQWAFVKKEGTPYNFYIYNHAKGDDKVLYLASENEIALTISDKNATKGFTNFYIQPQAFSGITNGFTIRPNSENTHAVGDHKGGVLGYWTTRRESEGTELNDAGSVFQAVDLIGDCKTLAVASSNNYIGSISTTALADLNATTTWSNFFTKYDELKTNATLYTQPVDGHLYRAHFTRGNLYITENNTLADANGNVNTSDESRLMKLADTDGATTATSLFKFENKGDYYVLQSANSGLYWGRKSDDSNNRLQMVANSEWCGHYVVDYDMSPTLGQVGLKELLTTDDTKRYLWSAYSSIQNNDNDIIKFHSRCENNKTTGTIESGAVLAIEEQTTYPITFKADYATLCLPFAVDLVEGVKAYTASNATSTELAMEGLTSTIPANTPVILTGTNGTSYNLPINYDKTTPFIGTNYLSGSTVKRSSLEANTYYGLSVGSDNTVGFHISSITTVPANKAYLEKSRLTNTDAAEAVALICNFNGGGEVTNIKSTTLNNEANDIYYDLNGRRVLYPTHGIYVKVNGQKVCVK